MEVQQFCDRVERDLNGLVDELQALTGRSGANERAAWQASLQRVSVLLAQPQLQAFRECHLHLGQHGGMSLEYRLPASSSWCDLVLLGRGDERPSAVLVELKNWDTTGDRPGQREGLIEHAGEQKLHPSDQVRGYTDYCRRFHSAVLESGAELSGCVYFTRPMPTHAYTAPPHDKLTADFPIFTDSPADIDDRFPEFLTTRLRRPDVNFAERFERGVYTQDRDFCRQMAEQIRNPSASPFVLLDAQRRGFQLCYSKIQEALAHNDPQVGKTVIFISGPPGSGKSVVAARLWAELIRSDIGNIVITTTSASQRSNWQGIFQTVAKSGAGAGVIKPASEYKPETDQWLKRYRDQHHVTFDPEDWRNTLELCRKNVGRLRMPDNNFDVSIVDEAHALINTEHRMARVGPTGWPNGFGPQAYHIIRASRVSIFLMDSDQSFRDRETTTPYDIVQWALEQGATVAEPISLAGQQFRAAGSVEYIDWLDACLGLRDFPPETRWRRSKAHPHGKMIFEIVDDPQSLEDALRPHIASGASARLVAAYGRPWKTKKARAPHDLPPEGKDFDIWFTRNGERRRWSKIWNYAPGTQPDYTLFVQAPEGTRMHDDPLSEVGCPYVVRGFDYTYLGVLWLKDLVWRRDHWEFDVRHIHESGLRLTCAAAKKEKGHRGPASRELLRRLQLVYRILLSRALRGLYVWFEDEETRRHVESLLPS